MEFTFDTAYGQKAVTAMARTLRKTIRKKRSRRAHVFGWIVLFLAVLLVLPLGGRAFVLNIRTVTTLAAALILLAALLCEDRINGYFARKRMLNGTERAASAFREDGYRSVTELGTTEWTYDKIALLAETSEYFVFVFGPNHAQLYDKRGMTGGTEEQFRAFMEEKTQKEMLQIK